MDSNLLQRQVAYTKKCFFEQGYLDREQFTQLEELQDDANPNFAEEIVSLFYNDSARLIRSIEQTMVSKPMDFEKLDNYMHQFKGSSSSIGANRVTDACSQFREFCLAGNLEGCIGSFLQVKQEHEILKKKLDTYFQLDKLGKVENVGGHQVG
ncbi:histidine-containing phosphotransfer protein 4-like isoform X1 [Benincasa hispida]|uniref:histidine-containing phosphotransfer protein 4-like isoform X1 n=1 Tax=Benincasa hispida TaxID=102211 RepID=UPI0019008EB9|nr:histidine-containing phosphotransfer protein 4-like isoform X1 [Benincasa hispida]